MIAQEELNELVQRLGVIRVDSTLRLVNDNFYSQTELSAQIYNECIKARNKARRKNQDDADDDDNNDIVIDAGKTFNFFVGLYECYIKKKII
jgi:hypothetical protein